MWGRLQPRPRRSTLSQNFLFRVWSEQLENKTEPECFCAAVDLVLLWPEQTASHQDQYSRLTLSQHWSDRTTVQRSDSTPRVHHCSLSRTVTWEGQTYLCCLSAFHFSHTVALLEARGWCCTPSAKQRRRGQKKMLREDVLSCLSSDSGRPSCKHCLCC